MYIRPVHAELDVPTLHTFLETYPLGLFTTHLPGHPTIPPLQTTHIPFVLDRPSPSPSSITTDGSITSTTSTPSLGTLRAHMARANPQTKALLYTLAAASKDSSSPSSTTLNDEVLVLFNAPVHSYVTPSFYVATKPTTGKVVPTWNYAAVQVYGRLRVHHSLKPDATEATGAFLSKQLNDLTDQNESRRFRKEGGGCTAANPEEEEVEGESKKGWKVSDAPSSYVELLKKGIVGLEIEITRIEGRFKLSQETRGDDEGDWRGVVDGFNGLGTEDGRVMARMVEERGRKD